MAKKKLTYEFVKESFEKEGYTLLSEEYKNAHIKLNYVCPKKHEHSIRWHNWRQGQRCPYCAGLAKLTIEQVRKSFENEGYTLLSKEYINSYIKLNYICSQKHKHTTPWNSWMSGHRCPSCAGLAKPTLEKIREIFEKDGYVLLSEKYKNANTKLEYVCSKGHTHSIKWDNWQHSRRCPTCAIIRHIGSGNPNWQGGISFEPYCEVWKDEEYKKDIRERDGNKCLNPYCSSKKPESLAIHHIDYNKKNCHPSNLITVCRTCNVMANKDRDWHTTWYQAIVKNRYYSRST